MTTINVQFADSTDAVIVGYFAGPQNPTAWPNQGTVQSNDSRWEAFYNAQPSIFQQGLPTPATS